MGDLLNNDERKELDELRKEKEMWPHILSDTIFKTFTWSIEKNYFNGPTDPELLTQMFIKHLGKLQKGF